MKKTLSLFAGVALLASCAPSEPAYKIEGKLLGDSEALKSGKVYLSNMDRMDQIRDTADIVNGEFVFEGAVLTPEVYMLTVEGTEMRLPIFLENAEFVVGGSETEPNVSGGGDSQTAMNKISAIQKEVEAKYDLNKISSEYRAASEERQKEIAAIFEKATEEMQKLEDSILDEVPGAHIVLSKIQTAVNSGSADLAELKEDLETFVNDVKFAENKVLKSIQETMATLEKVQVGMIAPEITSTTPDGKELSLSELYKKNKLTMIDFWAGWCPPCRAFNPKLVELYKKYNKDGFEVFGVSFDRDRETWLKAIEDDKLTWPQVSDIKYWDNEDAKTYFVRAIPMSVFVDQEGKIVARNPDKEDIEELIKEYTK